MPWALCSGCEPAHWARRTEGTLAAGEMNVVELSERTGSYVEVAGVRTFFIKKGTGPALFLFHGTSPGACTLVNWAPCIDHFASSGFTVYAFDQAGLGLTDNPMDLSHEFRVQHALAFVDQTGESEYCLVGNSQGGYAAARIAVARPARTKKLVLIASGGVGPPASPEAEAISRQHGRELGEYVPSLENIRKLTEGTIYSHELITDELIQLRYEMSAGKNYEAQMGRRAGPPTRPVNEGLRSLNIPTMIMCGLNDTGWPPEKGLVLMQAIPGSELHLFDRCGHWPMWDQTARFNTVLRDFLIA
jgi:pimeloyl-ACP methyl ester carboxylesterase